MEVLVCAIELAAGSTGKVTLFSTGIIRVDGGNATGENNTSVGAVDPAVHSAFWHRSSQPWTTFARGVASIRGTDRPEGETRGGNGSGGRIAIHSLDP